MGAAEILPTSHMRPAGRTLGTLDIEVTRVRLHLQWRLGVSSEY